MSISIDVHGDPVGAGLLVTIGINDKRCWLCPHFRDTACRIYTYSMVLYISEGMQNLQAVHNRSSSYSDGRAFLPTVFSSSSSRASKPMYQDVVVLYSHKEPIRSL